jgi:hypothetical protein
MNKMYIPLLIGTLSFAGCSSAPPIQKASMTKSYFDGAAYPGEVYKLADDNSGADQYRVFSHGSTGFVSLASVQSNAEGRAKDFCGKEGKIVKVLQQQTSTPPHVLGNFPRVELIFICIDKSKAVEQSNKPTPDQKNLPVGGSSATMESAKAKCLDLGFKVGTESFGQCILKITK